LFATLFLSQGFVKAKMDTSMSSFVVACTPHLLLYVDDIVLTASSPDLQQRFISSLQ
jgi:hypothetical protein